MLGVDSGYAIALILIGLIQIILILSVVHISAKTDEIANELKKLNENFSKIEKK
ncbi:MAG: hypothetical protein J5999_01070 [Oscillospiraceae bacterium]|nr:hypothetical protein [Oscillospiraceae bacterium]